MVPSRNVNIDFSITNLPEILPFRNQYMSSSFALRFLGNVVLSIDGKDVYEKIYDMKNLILYIFFNFIQGFLHKTGKIRLY